MSTILTDPFDFVLDPLEDDVYEDDWRDWSLLMEDLLRDLGYWKYVSGEHERPSPEPGDDSKADAAAAWAVADRKALGTIRMRVGSSAVWLVSHVGSSREAWAALKRYFEAPHRKLSRALHIKRQLFTARYNEDEEGLDKWLDRMAVWNSTLEWLGYPLGECDFAILLLMALPDEAWREFKMTVRNEDHAHPRDLVRRIRQYGRWIYATKGDRRTQPQKRRPPPKCFTCGKVGLARECPNHERKKKHRHP